MTAAWICSLLLLAGFNLKCDTKIETCIWAIAFFGYLSFLAYLTYIMGK